MEIDNVCQTCIVISSSLTPGKASKMLHEGRVHGRPLTDKQRRFFACRAHGGCSNASYGSGEEPSAELVIDLLNRRTRKDSHRALAMLSEMFLGSPGEVQLEFSDCLGKT